MKLIIWVLISFNVRWFRSYQSATLSISDWIIETFSNSVSDIKMFSSSSYSMRWMFGYLVRVCKSFIMSKNKIEARMPLWGTFFYLSGLVASDLIGKRAFTCIKWFVYIHYSIVYCWISTLPWLKNYVGMDR